jgi:hypothetical protein
VKSSAAWVVAALCTPQGGTLVLDTQSQAGKLIESPAGELYLPYDLWTDYAVPCCAALVLLCLRHYTMSSVRTYSILNAEAVEVER